MKVFRCFAIALLSGALLGCSDNLYVDEQLPESEETHLTRAVVPEDFDWETVDYMPTPAGQTKIPVPWIGQGSLASSYTIDVINDHKKADGWVMLYSTFTDKGTSPLQNPYFILYNKYRGLMRVYLYITTQFVTTSSYLQDGLSVNTTRGDIKLLNFLGREAVDGTSSRTSYQQIQPAPMDGSRPLATNKWYMMQYELAYDPNISSIPYNDIRLVWNANYMNVSSISLGGDIQGTIKGVIGEQSDGSILKAVEKDGVKAGTGALAILGKDFLKKYKTGDDGSNTLGLSKTVFKSVFDGVEKATSNFSSGITSGVVNLLSAIIGGTKSTTVPISLNLEAQVKLTGSETNIGALPSTPIAMYMPGTQIPATAQGQIPLYNTSLGVCNMFVKPDFVITEDVFNFDMKDQDPSSNISHITESFATIPSKSVDYTKYLIINPELQKIADVTIKQDIIGTGSTDPWNPSGGNKPTFGVNPTGMYSCNGAGERSDYVNIGYDYSNFYVRFTITIKPNDGTPTSVIYKSFKLNTIWNTNFHSGIPDYSIFN